MRHDQLYRSFLWKDSIVEFVTSISPSTTYVPTANYMPTKGRVILPSIIQQVLGVRLGHHALNVQRPMLYYRADYSRFLNNGCVHEFELLSSCVWEFDTVQNLTLIGSSSTDNGLSVTIDQLSSDEVSIARNVLALATGGTALSATDRIDNIIKPATVDTVSLLSGYSNPSTVSVNGVTCYTEFTISGTIFGDGDYVWDSVSSTWKAVNGLGLTNNAKVDSINGGWEINAASINASLISLTSNNFPPYDQSQQWTFDLAWTEAGGTKPPVFVLPIIPVYSIVYTLQPTDTVAPKCQRIQLVSIPKTTSQRSESLHVLGKRNTPPFAADTDVCGINGLDGVLVALAYYDFKQRDESGGSADAATALNEAVGPRFLTAGVPGGFLGKLIEEEVIQAAYNCRIVPQYGFGGCNNQNEWDSKANPYDY